MQELYPVHFRPWTVTDRDAFLGLFNDARVVRYMDDGLVHEERNASLFEKIFTLNIGPDQKFAYLLAVEWQGRIVGHLELKTTEHTKDNEWEMVYALSPEVWGKGLGSQVAAWALETTKRHGRHMVATVDPENLASLHILTKLGLQSEAILEDGTVVLREKV